MLTGRGARRKGERGEREVLAFLRDHLGDHLVRARGEGSNDHGDIAGLPRMVVQAKNYTDVIRAILDGLEGAAAQKANAGADWGCAFVRRRGGRWIVVMEPADWVSMYREAALSTADRIGGGFPDGDERDGEEKACRRCDGFADAAGCSAEDCPGRKPQGPVDALQRGEEHDQRG